MKKIFIIGIILVCVGFVAIVSLGKLSNPARMFQDDADLARLEHLEYWTGLIEEYYNIKGSYPFQKNLKDQEIAIVRISTKQQQEYFTPGSKKYNNKFDNNYGNRFSEYSVKEFVNELESTLNKPILEKYDIQKVPTASPVGYNYFISSDGYLLWVTCISCGVTEISTLLMDGFTPTVNIVSDGMKGKVTKAYTREEMINHPVYKKWKSRAYNNEAFVRQRENDNFYHTKNSID